MNCLPESAGLDWKVLSPSRRRSTYVSDLCAWRQMVHAWSS